MKEREPTEQPYGLTHDDQIDIGALSFGRRTFRVRAFEKLGSIPVVIASDTTPERPNISRVTQVLAADVLHRYFSRRLWEDQPMRWFEEERKLRHKGDNVVERLEYWEVLFRSFLPRRVRAFGQKLYQIPEASRRPTKVGELETLLGLRME